MDKPWTTLRVAHRLPTGRRLPTSSTALRLQSFKSWNVKTISPAPTLAYSTPVAVQTTGTTEAQECRRQCLLVAQANSADTAVQQFMNEALADFSARAVSILCLACG
jgi:hypothetical protein